MSTVSADRMLSVDRLLTDRLNISRFHRQYGSEGIFSIRGACFSGINFSPTNVRPPYSLSSTIYDQNKTCLCCDADHHAVPPINLRPVDHPDHFSVC